MKVEVSVLGFPSIIVRAVSVPGRIATLNELVHDTLFEGISVSLSFWYHALRLLLVSFILGDSNWNFFQVGYPVDSPTNSGLKQTPFGIPP